MPKNNKKTERLYPSANLIFHIYKSVGTDKFKTIVRKYAAQHGFKMSKIFRGKNKSKNKAWVDVFVSMIIQTNRIPTSVSIRSVLYKEADSFDSALTTEEPWKDWCAHFDAEEPPLGWLGWKAAR